MSELNPAANMWKCWHEGKTILQSDEGLVIRENKLSGSTGKNGDEPTYPLENSEDIGLYGPNPWRKK
jgi:hypothetical protein